MEPIDADAIPGSESRSLQSQYWRLGTGGGWCAGALPSSIRVPDVDVAAAGVPHPAGCEGWSGSDEGHRLPAGGQG
jgi:hypothetical protein